MPETSPFRLFPYVGPPHFIEKAFSSERFRIESSSDLSLWLKKKAAALERDGTFVSTYVITEDNEFWVADRRSEHVGCARGKRVKAAGEIFQERTGAIERITNQSTGYCPSVECWSSVQAMLSLLNIPLTLVGFDPAFEFRRCTSCGEVQLVKDEFYFCLKCSEQLSAEWNVS